VKIHWWVLIIALALGAYTYYGFTKFVECVTVHKDLPSVCLLDKVRTKFMDQPAE
jgi:hypothetical protein